ncbi:hypothetical protein BKA70DRAFT_1238183 [Coprinopsis sp. MPI-PUGE-AT-0042]|nr:hypothetical protein BKA70DRAFT_1238183 [Coprinopsis sp. MPI-PUGE-AT-0042]
MSLALAKGHLGVFWLLQEFESRRARPCTAQFTHEDAMHPGHLVSEDPVDEEARSGCDSEDLQSSEEWLVGDEMIDRDASDAQGNDADAEEEEDWTQDEPLLSRRDAKRPRDDDEDGLEGAVDDTDAPAPKRHRCAVFAEDP